MSKKSNAFQKAIYFIQSELKGSNITVEESVEIPEIHNGTEIKREIDVLLTETLPNGHFKKIAIECRDRKNKDEIGWIDGLIGKYKDLNIDKIIAVSSSGFSKSATLKAKSHNIDTQTIKQIKSKNWKRVFLKLGVCDVSLKFDVNEILIETENTNLDTKILNGDSIINYNNSEEGTFNEFWPKFRSYWEPRFKQHWDKNFLNNYKTREDLTKFAVVEYRVPMDNLRLKIGHNKYTKIIAFNLKIVGNPVVKISEVKHYKYQNSLISRTALPSNDDNIELNLVISQAKANNKINVAFDKKVKKKK